MSNFSYNPGVNDIRGQLLASGISSAANSIAGGIVQYGQQREQNKLFEAKTKSTVAYIKSHAPEFGLTDEKLDALLANNPQESPMQRYSRLDGFIGNVAKDQILQQQKQELEKAKQEMETEKVRQNLIRAQTGDVTRRGKQDATDVAALGKAAAPRQLTPAEGLYVARSPQRDPTSEEAALAYMRAGGSPSAAAMDVMKLLPSSKKAKPSPGSLGYKVQDFPGLGKIMVDLATGEPVDGGKIIKPTEKKNDEKALTAEEIQQIQALEQSGRDLSSLDQAFGEIGDQDWGGPIAGRVRAIASMGTSPNISRIQNLVTAATPNLARGVFRERGVLTDADVERYQKLLPNVNDTAAQRKQKLADLRTRLHETTGEVLSTLQAAGRDVQGLREKILGGGKTANQANADEYKDETGTYPIKTIRGQRGIIKGGAFYPLLP